MADGTDSRTDLTSPRPSPLPAGAEREKAPRERLVPNPKARLREQFHEVARFKHLSLRSERTYWDWSVRYLRFHRDRNVAQAAPGEPSSGLRPSSPGPAARPTRPHPASPPSPAPAGEGGWRHPREMGGVEVREFLTHLAAERHVAPATQNQALNIG